MYATLSSVTSARRLRTPAAPNTRTARPPESGHGERYVNVNAKSNSFYLEAPSR